MDIQCLYPHQNHTRTDPEETENDFYVILISRQYLMCSPWSSSHSFFPSLSTCSHSEWDAETEHIPTDNLFPLNFHQFVSLYVRSLRKPTCYSLFLNLSGPSNDTAQTISGDFTPPPHICISMSALIRLLRKWEIFFNLKKIKKKFLGGPRPWHAEVPRSGTEPTSW